MLSLCKYYHGEKECPEVYREKPMCDFWHGEKMFVESNVNLEKWVNYGIETLKELPQDKKQIALNYSPESFAIILYIEMLYSKWCPYDTMEWIYKY